MKNEDLWKPSKYVERGGRLCASHDPTEVGIGSRLITDRVAAFYARALPEYARGRLVDLGCGKAPLYGAYRQLVTHITCVDWEHSAHGSEYIDFACDLAGELPLTDETFDTVILSDVLEHVCRPAHLWQEMARILAPKGHILMNVPFYYWLHETPHDYFRYTEYALEMFVKESGLTVVELTPLGGLPDVFIDLLGKSSASLPIVGRFVASALQQIRMRSGVSREAAGQSETASRRFPLAYAVVATKGEV